MQCGIQWKFNENLKSSNSVLKSRYGHGMGIFKNSINIAVLAMCSYTGSLISSQLSTVYSECSIRVFIYSLRGYSNT